MPEPAHDFQFGAPRFVQRAQGYKVTLVNGDIILLDDEPAKLPWSRITQQLGLVAYNKLWFFGKSACYGWEISRKKAGDSGCLQLKKFGLDGFVRPKETKTSPLRINFVKIFAIPHVVIRFSFKALHNIWQHVLRHGKT